MATFTVPYSDDSDSGSSLLAQEDPSPRPPQPSESPTPMPTALGVVKRCKPLTQDVRPRVRNSQLRSQNQHGGHTSNIVDQICEVKENMDPVMDNSVFSDLSIPADNSKPNRDGLSLSEITNAPWPDDDDDAYMVTPANKVPFYARTPSPRHAKLSSTTPSSADSSSDGVYLLRKPSLTSTQPAQHYTGGNASRRESYISICSSNGIFFDQEDSDRKSTEYNANAPQDRTRLQNHLFTPSNQGSRPVLRGQENEEGLMIDDAILYMFNCWNHLDYQQYLWKIEGDLTTETRRNNTWVIEDIFVKQVSFDYYKQSNPFRDVPETKTYIIIHRLPLPSPD